MNLKYTKILIPEIPKEWTNNIRSGHTNIWNGNGAPEVRLEPPIEGLYAERFDDGWFWVCGCHKCLENGKPYSYIVCYEHDRCVTCKTHRTELKETPWGRPDGFQCKPCAEKEHEEDKRKALEEAQERGHSEDDCYYTANIICPVCGSECSDDDMHEKSEHEVTCDVCDTEFNVQVEYEARYTSSLKQNL
jgi:hypothetical protein